MLVEVETDDRFLGFELFDLGEGITLSVGDQRTIPGDATIIYEGTTGYKSFGFSETVTFVLSSVAGPITIGLVTNWLYDKLKGRAKKLRIDRREITIEKGEITRILEETIREE